jgi:hypothetical protein
VPDTYAAYRYLWPPRPERAVPPPALDRFAALGWWAQPKLNGTNCLLYVSPDRVTIARGRHGDTPLKSWAPGPRWAAFADRLPGAGWFVLHGELLHTKGSGRDAVYLHDLLVADGDYLIGTTYRDRYASLRALCGDRLNATPTHYDVLPGVQLAAVYTAQFRDRFDMLPAGIEGLVVKNPEAALLPCLRPASNSAWQVKCRRPTANLSF